MKNGAISGLLLAMWAWASPAQDIAFPLHPQAELRHSEKNGQQGALPMSVAAAARNWGGRLEAAGWRREASLDLPGKGAHDLTVWSKDGIQVSLLLLEEEPGRTLFLWNLMRDEPAP